MAKICKETEILNPVSKRCVKKDGVIGRKILIANEKINIFWERNSCYIDSALLSIFHNKDKFIEDILLKAPLHNYKNELNKIGNDIRKELIKIYDIISNRKIDKINNCSILRKLLNDYYKNFIKIYPNKYIIDKREDWQKSQLDTFDIFDLLNIIFDYNNFVYNIPFDLLIEKKKILIKNIFKTSLLKSNKIVLKIFRNSGTTKLNIKVIPSKTIKLPKNSFDLHLTSIIIHFGNIGGGHYICLYKSNNKWFEYDDLHKSPTYIGSLSKIIKNDKYISNIVGLVYSK